MRIFRSLTVVVAAFVLFTAGADAADRTITDLPGPTTLDVEGDLAVVNVWKSYDAARPNIVNLKTGKLTPLPVKSRPRPEHPNLGTDESGQPVVVFKTCRGSRCKVMRIDLETDGTPKSGASRVPGLRLRPNDATPSVSEGDLAFSRGGKLFARALDGPDSGGVRPLPGVPKTNCKLAVTKGQCKTSHRSFDVIKKRGDRLAVIMSYRVGGKYWYYEDVRSIDIATPANSRSVAARRFDAGGTSSLMSPSLDGRGRVLYGFTCFLGCPSANYFRFDPRTNTTQQTRLGDETLEAVAPVRDGALFVSAKELTDSNGCKPRCPLTLSSPPKWRAGQPKWPVGKPKFPD